jgi:hypothetical protein
MAVDPLSQAAFEEFVVQRKRDLERIGRSTRNEYELVDVANEAWLKAFELKARKNVAVDFLDRSFQDLLIRHLYQHLVRYTERNVRYATRLDHAVRGGDRDSESPPLMHTLISDDGRHPLTVLIEREETSSRLSDVDLSNSLAGAYVRLLRHFDNKMRVIADHLLISKSYAYRRCAHARWLVARQKSVPLSMMEEAFIPGPWRRFRLWRAPTQLAFDFDNELPLESLRSCTDRT